MMDFMINIIQYNIRIYHIKKILCLIIIAYILMQ